MVHTLRELERVCQKSNWRQVGSLPARRFARPIALYVTYLLVRWQISANTVTTVALLVGLAGCGLLACGSPGTFVAGVALLCLWYLIDHVDGQVARYRRAESVTGIYLDFVMHHLVHAAVGFGLGYGLAVHYGQLEWTLAGGTFAAGIVMIGLANDCKYKAIFAQLVRDRAVLHPEACNRPVQSPSHLRRLVGLPFRLGYKMCEIPNVLIALLILVVGLAFDVTFGFGLTGCYVGVMALLAPGLAAARIGNQVRTVALDREYSAMAHSADSERAETVDCPARPPCGVFSKSP